MRTKKGCFALDFPRSKDDKLEQIPRSADKSPFVMIKQLSLWCRKGFLDCGGAFAPPRSE